MHVRKNTQEKDNADFKTILGKIRTLLDVRKDEKFYFEYKYRPIAPIMEGINNIWKLNYKSNM